MNDEHEDIEKFFNELPDTFDIMEEGIDLQTQNEYFGYSHSFDRGELTEDETINLGNLLNKPFMKLEGKKKALVLLAHLGTITAFRQIEKYYKNPDKELKPWAALALQECRMFLESTLEDRSIGFISTGLGGVKDKLRYFFLIISSTEGVFTETQKRIIDEEFLLVAKNLNCEIEALDHSETFVGLTVLVPMDVAVGTFVETGIKMCNELGNFVFEYYYATNQDIPDEKEIMEIIRIVRG